MIIFVGIFFFTIVQPQNPRATTLQNEDGVSVYKEGTKGTYYM